MCDMLRTSNEMKGAGRREGREGVRGREDEEELTNKARGATSKSRRSLALVLGLVTFVKIPAPPFSLQLHSSLYNFITMIQTHICHALTILIL